MTVENNYDTEIYLDKAELNRIHTEIFSGEGAVYHIPYSKEKGMDYYHRDEKKVANPYSYGAQNSKDQLIVKSRHGEVELLEVQ